MTQIIEHPAKHISANADETLEQYKRRLREERSAIAYDNDLPIDLNPNLEYSLLVFGMQQRATPEQFAKFSAAVMGLVKAMEDAGELPEGWIASVGTAIDVTPPVIPDRFLAECDEGVKLIARLSGYTYFDIITQYPPDPADENHEDDPANSDSDRPTD